MDENLWDVVKVVFREKYIVWNVYNKKENGMVEYKWYEELNFKDMDKNNWMNLKKGGERDNLYRER